MRWSSFSKGELGNKALGHSEKVSRFSEISVCLYHPSGQLAQRGKRLNNLLSNMSPQN